MTKPYLNRETGREFYLDHDEMTLANTIATFLNEVYELDPKAISKLLSLIVPCNEGLSNHLTVVVRRLYTESSTPEYVIGVLGFINGLLSDDIAIAFDIEEKVFKVCARYSHPDDVQVIT